MINISWLLIWLLKMDGLIILPNTALLILKAVMPVNFSLPQVICSALFQSLIKHVMREGCLGNDTTIAFVSQFLFYPGLQVAFKDVGKCEPFTNLLEKMKSEIHL